MKKPLYEGYTPEFPTWWKILQGWIVLPLIPFGLTVWITFGYLAWLLKRWYLWLFAFLYTLPTGVAFVHYIASGRPTSITSDFTTKLIYNIVLVAWLFSIVHCGFLWKDYMLACKIRRRKATGEKPTLKTD